MARERKRVALPKRAFRSGLTTGRRLLDDVDGRTLVARRFRDVQALIADDLGSVDRLTEAQLQIVRSAAGLIILRENLDAQAARGEPISITEYCRIANSLRRVLQTLGLKRVSRDITPTLGDYLRAKDVAA